MADVSLAAIIAVFIFPYGDVRAQEQQGESNLLVSPDDLLPTSQQKQPGGAEWERNQRTGQRKTVKPGVTIGASSTTIILGGRGERQKVIVQENIDGQSGLVIGGVEQSPEERARLVAKENLQQNSVIDPVNGPESNVNTTVQVDSIVVQHGSKNSSSQTNKACVQIGVVGGNGACTPTQ